MNDRSSMRSIRRRKWSSATNDSKSMLALALGSNACTPCMAASLLENSGVPNATIPETRTNSKNQVESAPNKVLFFNRPERLVTCSWPARNSSDWGAQSSDAAWDCQRILIEELSAPPNAKNWTRACPASCSLHTFLRRPNLFLTYRGYSDSDTCPLF